MSSTDSNRVAKTVGRIAGMALVAGAVMFGTTAARAGTPYSIDREVDEVRGWTIAANAQRQGCFAFATFKSDTSIELGFDTK